jgi:hypothetical protein
MLRGKRNKDIHDQHVEVIKSLIQATPISSYLVGPRVLLDSGIFNADGEQFISSPGTTKGMLNTIII